MRAPRLQDLREWRYRARRERGRKKRVAAEGKRARRVVVTKAVVCVCLVLVLLLLAIMVGTSDYQATAIGWGALFAALFAIALAFAYIQVAKRTVGFSEQASAQSCERGQSITFDIGFANRSVMFIFSIEAYFYISDLFGNIASQSSQMLALSPRKDSTMSFDATFEHIGNYTAGLDRIVIKDFLGLFTHTITNTTRYNVNVTPRLQLIDHLTFSEDAMLEATTAAKSIIADSMDYSHVRDYVPGDPLKTIHWKLSARANNYLTRLYEVYTNPGVGVILDFYGPSDEATVLMGMFDAVVECGFSIAQYAQQQGMETELYFCDKHKMPRGIDAWGRDDLPDIVAEMPSMSNDPLDAQGALDILLDQINSQRGQNNLVVCSANVTGELVSAIVDAKMRRRNPLFVAVVPHGLEGRALDAYVGALSRLDAVDVPYIVLSSSDELVVKCA